MPYYPYYGADTVTTSSMMYWDGRLGVFRNESEDEMAERAYCKNEVGTGTVLRLKKRDGTGYTIRRPSRWDWQPAHHEHDAMPEGHVPTTMREREPGRYWQYIRDDGLQHPWVHRMDTRRDEYHHCRYLIEGTCDLCESCGEDCYIFCSMGPLCVVEYGKYSIQYLSTKYTFYVPPWSKIVRCEHCGKKLKTSSIDKWIGENSKHYCKTCYHQLHKKCHICGKWHIMRGMKAVHSFEKHTNVYVCQRCVRADLTIKCHDCGRDMLSQETLRVIIPRVEQYTICPSCGEDEDRYILCARCGNLIPREHTRRMPDDLRMLCIPCYEQERTGRMMRFTGWKPKISLRDTSDSSRLLTGCEIETDTEDRTRNRVDYMIALKEALGDSIHTKGDGSLHNGIEICTQPCTLAYHQECNDYETIYNIAKQYGWDAEGLVTPGLHVHASKWLIPDEIRYRYIWLFHRFWDQMLAFSRRKDIDRLERYAAQYKYIATGIYDLQSTRNAILERCGKYRCVNIQNSSTIETRLFAGAIEPHHIRGAVECVYLLADIARKGQEDRHDWQGIDWNTDVIHRAEQLDYLNFLRCCREVEICV